MPTRSWADLEARTPARRRCWPDSKSQVTVQYEHGKPVVSARSWSRITSVEDIPRIRCATCVDPMCAKRCPRTGSTQTVWHVNPTGKFFIGRSRWRRRSHRRRSSVDTMVARPDGGGAFSGKGPDQGRSFGPYAAAISQEHRGRGPRDAARCSSLTHRRGAAAVDLQSIPWHRKRAREKLRSVAEAMD